MSVREHWINVRVNPEELARIREKQKELGIRNTGAYMRKMAMDGYCVNLDLSDVAQVSTLLRRCSNNLNQYAKRANESGSIYAEDADVRLIIVQAPPAQFVQQKRGASPDSSKVRYFKKLLLCSSACRL